MPTNNTPKDRCNEIVARTPQVILERSVTPGDYTHLQFCGAPVFKWHLCKKHYAQQNRGIDSRWRRFLRRGGAA